MALLRTLSQFLIAKPIAKFVIGMDVIGKERLPLKGPAIIAANHNSHIDTLILLCLFPASVLSYVQPVGAADHFLKTPFMRWFSKNIIGMIPIERKASGSGQDLLESCRTALAAEKILVIFPEGTRGQAEQTSDFKTGVARLASGLPDCDVYPVYIQGAGRVLPRGSKLLVPFNCTAIVGKSLSWAKDSQEDRHVFMDKLKLTIEDLKDEAVPLRWD